LGTTLNNLNRVDEAIVEMNNCSHIIVKYLGETCSQLNSVYENLGISYMLKNQPEKALGYFKKGQTTNQSKMLADCYISLKKFENADEQFIKYYDSIYTSFINDFKYISQKAIGPRKFSIIIPLVADLLNYAIFRLDQNPSLLNYVVNKWLILNNIALKKGRIIKEQAKNAGVAAEYKDLLTSLSHAVEIPPYLRDKLGLNLDELIHKQNKIEMLICERFQWKQDENALVKIRNQLKRDENFLFLIPFTYKNLLNVSSQNISEKSGGEYSYFVGSIDKFSTTINFVILKDALEISQEPYQKYISYVTNPKLNPEEDEESYRTFVKPIEHLLQYSKTFFAAGEIYNKVNIEAIYHPIKRMPILDVYNISYIENPEFINGVEEPVKFYDVALFGGVDYGNGLALAKNINEYNENNCPIGIDFILRPENKSLLIFEVKPGSSADEGGLIVGDEIMQIDGRNIEGDQDKSYYISKILGKEGTSVLFKIRRISSENYLNITIKRMPLPKVAPIIRYEYLPASLSEVQEIEKILAPISKILKTYTGKIANEYNLKNLHQPNILHLATHSTYWDPENVSYEYIKASPLVLNNLFLAGINDFDYNFHPLNQENGIVNGLEILNLPLDSTDLVVISGCKSGQGTYGIGEGIMGFKEAILTAGAKNVILANETINDGATRDFFSRFYSKLAKGLSVETSLRQTKIEIQEKYNHPYYWSSFRLYKR
jgi:hypothetical protein